MRAARRAPAYGRGGGRRRGIFFDDSQVDLEVGGGVADVGFDSTCGTPQNGGGPGWEFVEVVPRGSMANGRATIEVSVVACSPRCPPVVPGSSRFSLSRGFIRWVSPAGDPRPPQQPQEQPENPNSCGRGASRGSTVRSSRSTPGHQGQGSWSGCSSPRTRSKSPATSAGIEHFALESSVTSTVAAAGVCWRYQPSCVRTGVPAWVWPSCRMVGSSRDRTALWKAATLMVPVTSPRRPANAASTCAPRCVGADR